MKNIFIHELAVVETDNIGEDTKIWQFAIILPGAIIGRNCNINCHTLIEGDVHIGDNVTLKSGVFLWDGVRVEDNVFIGPNATFVNDKYPRSKAYLSSYKAAYLKKGCTIGANATIMNNVKIGEYAMIGAGAVITKDVPNFALVVGNPARQVGIVNKRGEKLTQDSIKDIFLDEAGNKYKLTDNNLFEI